MVGLGVGRYYVSLLPCEPQGPIRMQSSWRFSGYCWEAVEMGESSSGLCVGEVVGMGFVLIHVQKVEVSSRLTRELRDSRLTREV